MADFAQTVENGLNIFGASPPNRWGEFLWGENWGASGDLATSYQKFLDSELLTFDDLTSKNFTHVYNDTMTFELDLDVCKRYEKWCLVWTGPTDNGVEAVYDEFTKI